MKGEIRVHIEFLHSKSAFLSISLLGLRQDDRAHPVPGHALAFGPSLTVEGLDFTHLGNTP